MKDGMIYYDVDTTSGQSGSPLLTVINQKLVAMGIHKGGSDIANDNGNYGVVLNPYNINQLK